MYKRQDIYLAMKYFFIIICIYLRKIINYCIELYFDQDGIDTNDFLPSLTSLHRYVYKNMIKLNKVRTVNVMTYDEKTEEHLELN